MFRFFLSRIAQTIAVLFTVSVIIFALMRVIPGDPVLMMLGDDFIQDAYQRLRAQERAYPRSDKEDPGEDPRARRAMTENGLYVIYARANERESGREWREVSC